MQAKKIIKREIAEPQFKKAPQFSQVNFLSNFYKKLQEAHAPQRQNIILSRRIDEGVAKDYRKDDLDNAASKGRFVNYVLRKYNHDPRY